MKQPVLFYAPDADSTTPGVITSGTAFVPSFRGYKAAPGAQDTILDALPGACVGAAGMLRLDTAVRFFAGTSTRLYEATTGSNWTDVSENQSDYTAVSNRWRFCQFGNVSIAASKTNFLQASTTGEFATIAGSIKADIVETVNFFVMAFNTDDEGAYGDRPHSWWCSALGDHTDWTPDIATQCATGELVSIPGPITAAKRFGDQIVVYKERGMYLGYYSGPPFIWSWSEIPSYTGTFCNESVVNIGTPEQPKHFFVGVDNFYVFDGTRPQPVGDGVKESFFAELNTSYADQICMQHDNKNSLVYIHYPSGSSTTLNACLVWNYRTGKWGRDDREIEYAVQYIAPSMTYGDIGTYYSTYADLPNAPYGSAFISFATGTPAFFNSSHKLQTLTATPGNSQIVTGDYGDDSRYSFLSRIKPKWLTKPAAATVQCRYRNSLGDPLLTGAYATMSNSRFDVRQSARWHRIELNMVGNWEMNELEATVVGAGRE